MRPRIGQCHFAYTAPRKAWFRTFNYAAAFCTEHAYSQPVTDCSLIKVKLSTGLFRPSWIWHRNRKKFLSLKIPLWSLIKIGSRQSRRSTHDHPVLIIAPLSTWSQAYHSYYNVTEASHFHSAAKVDPNPANVEVEDSSAFITTAVGVATKTACKQVAY